MKKILYMIAIISISIFSTTYSDTSTSNCQDDQWYELYKCRVKNICEEYKPDTIFYQTIEYENYDIKKSGDTENVTNIVPWENDLARAKSDYKNNMNNIYKCSMIWIQEKSLEAIQQLIANNTYLKTKLKKFKSQQDKLALIKKSLECKTSHDNNSIQKLQVLQQTSMELCKYNSYLEYIRERNSSIKNLIKYNDLLKEHNNVLQEDLIPDDVEWYNIWKIAELEREKKTEIDDEIQRAYKIFPLAYHAYSEYENNYSIHLLLELLREDFIAFRENYHKTINPINQVGYKIINAMKQ